MNVDSEQFSERRREDASDPTTLAIRAAWEVGDRVAAELAALRKQLHVVEKLLTGNGEPERGLIVRVDRIEQARELEREEIERADRRRTKLVGVALGAVATQTAIGIGAALIWIIRSMG